MKGDGDERAEAREGEGALLVADAQKRASKEEEGERDPGGGAEERPDGPAGDEELEEVSVGRLDDTDELAGLDDPERLAERAEARAEDRVALPGFDGVRPDEDAGVGTEVARVGGEKSQERARPEGGDDEEDAEGEAGGERGPLGRAGSLVAVGAGAEGEAGEKKRGRRRGEHAAAGVREGQGRGEEAPEEDAEGPRGNAPLEPRSVHGPALAGTAREGGDHEPEREREADAEVAGEVVGVEVGARDAPRLLLGGHGPGGLGGHAGEEDGREEPAAVAGDEERGGREERGGGRGGEEGDGTRFARRDGEARDGRRARAGRGEDRGRAAVNFEARGRERANEADRKGEQLKEPEETEGQEADGRHEGGAGRGPFVPAPKGNGRRGEERHQLDAKSTAGLDPAERERRRGREPENEEKAGRARRAGPQPRNVFTEPLKSLQALALLALALAPASILGAGAPADDFYLVRLQSGKAEAAAGRHYEAIDDFRIASFGFIDQPALLVEGLSRLALAQAAAGRNDDADATLRRLVEVERRFDGWPEADLEPETRAAVVALAGKRLGAEAASLLVVPPKPVAAPASAVVPAAAQTVPSPTPAPAPESNAAVVPPPAAPVGPPSPPASLAVLGESKALVSQGRYVENLRRLVAAVAADPKDRELRKALLEGACLTKDWGTAVAQLEPLRPFRDGEEPWMFYAAVALHETGASGEARTLAEKALPRLNRSPFVDYYARRIVESAAKR